MDVLSSSLRKLIVSPECTTGEVPDLADIRAAIRSARANKLEILLRRSLSLNHTMATYEDVFAQDAKRVAGVNGKILQIILLTHKILRDADVAHVFYKGPLQQKILYGDFFAKRCLDADVLVDPKHFKKARAALTSAGFVVPKGYGGLWWTYFLGEQPLFAPGQSYSIDLHHRLQQPGSPAPRHITRFLDDSTSVALGSQIIPTIGLSGIAMVAAMNLVKAVYHREPTGGHAFDVVAALTKMSREEIRTTKEIARSQGLMGTLAFAAEIAAGVFAVDNPIGDESYRLPVDMQLAKQLVFNGNGQKLPRRKMLFHLCDRPLVDAPVETFRWLMSEAALHSMQVTGTVASAPKAA